MKLVYFKGRGSAEPIRILAAIAKVQVEDQYITTHDQWKAAAKPYGQVPVLILDNGELLSQSKAIIGYLGRAHGLYPTDNLEIARTEEVMEAASDFNTELSKAFTADKTLRATTIAGFKQTCARWLSVWDKHLKGKQFFVGNKVTVADIVAFKVLEDLVNYVGEADALSQYPEVAKFRKSFSSVKEVSEYMRSPRRLPLPKSEDDVAALMKGYGEIIRGA